MIAVRRYGEPLGARKLHGFQGSGKHVFEDRALVGGEFSEDVADHFAGPRAPYSELQAGKFVFSEVLEDGLDAVVAASGSLFPEAERAEGQGDVVVDDQHLGGRPLVEREDLLDRPPAQIHESLRFEQERAGAGELGEVALPLRDGLEFRTGCHGEAVQEHETHVVAGVLVLPAGIAEADDQGKRHG